MVGMMAENLVECLVNLMAVSKAVSMVVTMGEH